MKIFYIPFGIIMFLFSCESRKQENGSEQNLSDQPTRFVDATALKKFDPLISVRELFTDVDYIYLKSPDSIQITDISKILQLDDQLIIRDKKNKILLAFDLDGNFIGQIGKKGAGPGEYQEVSDFDINYPNKKIIIFSRADGAIYWFDKDLSFLEKKKIDAWGNQLAVLESENIAIYSYMDNKDDPFNIRIYDQSGNLVSKSMNFPQEKGHFSVPDFSGFIRGNYYSYPYSSNIYKIDERQTEDLVAFELDFPNRRPEEKKFDFPEPSRNPPPHNQFLAKFEIGKDQNEVIFYYEFLHNQGFGYTLGVSLADGQTFGHHQLYHGEIGKLDVYAKLFFLGPYNLPTYNKASGYYYVARNLGSSSYFYDEIKTQMKEIAEEDRKLYDILNRIGDIEEPFIMKFKLVERYNSKGKS